MENEKRGENSESRESGGENSRRLVISRADVNTTETMAEAADIAIAPPFAGE